MEMSEGTDYENERGCFFPTRSSNALLSTIIRGASNEHRAIIVPSMLENLLRENSLRDKARALKVLER